MIFHFCDRYYDCFADFFWRFTFQMSLTNFIDPNLSQRHLHIEILASERSKLGIDKCLSTSCSHFLTCFSPICQSPWVHSRSHLNLALWLSYLPGITGIYLGDDFLKNGPEQSVLWSWLGDPLCTLCRYPLPTFHIAYIQGVEIKSRSKAASIDIFALTQHQP